MLALLAEQPMHGYQIIHEIEERSGGSWKPSAGSVYPTLQLLADEGLISAEEANGRKIYALTEAGREEVAGAEAESESGSSPWESTESRVTRRDSPPCPRLASSWRRLQLRSAARAHPNRFSRR